MHKGSGWDREREGDRLDEFAVAGDLAMDGTVEDVRHEEPRQELQLVSRLVRCRLPAAVTSTSDPSPVRTISTPLLR